MNSTNFLITFNNGTRTIVTAKNHDDALDAFLNLCNTDKYFICFDSDKRPSLYKPTADRIYIEGVQEIKEKEQEQED